MSRIPELNPRDPFNYKFSGSIGMVKNGKHSLEEKFRHECRKILQEFILGIGNGSPPTTPKELACQILRGALAPHLDENNRPKDSVGFNLVLLIATIDAGTNIDIWREIRKNRKNIYGSPFGDAKGKVEEAFTILASSIPKH